MITLPTTLTVVNETDVRGQALTALIAKYISFPGVYYGFRSLSTPGLAYPCVMVDPRRQVADMKTLGKFHILIEYMIYFFVTESNPSALVSLATFSGEALIKLLSNNALNDIGGANSGKFKTYPGFWTNSDMSELLWTVTIPNAMPDGRSLRAGALRFQIEDQLVK